MLTPEEAEGLRAALANEDDDLAVVEWHEKTGHEGATILALYDEVVRLRSLQRGPLSKLKAPSEGEKDPKVWSSFLESYWKAYSEHRRDQDKAFEAEYQRIEVMIRTLRKKPC